MTLEAALSILGPALTTVGAALLAYDVLRGPARLLGERQHVERLDAAEQRREDTAQSLAETKDERSAGAQTAGMVAIEARHASTVRRVETAHADADVREQARTFRLAIWGLLLVVAGGVAETIAAVLVAARHAS
jgi:hypothetical protein